ncbi:MAG: hypothetical protein JO043_00595 [Candidatus Eremiobacteraeota bacterium]|nr:hypothetical protein [Candidatus Eremiobacteraeota bacterium]
MRVGNSVRAQGVPAILIGVSCVVAAAGIARAATGLASTVAESLADGLRERRAAAMLESLGRRSLKP